MLIYSEGRKLTEYNLQGTERIFQKNDLSEFTSIWITIRSRKVNPFRTSMTDLQ